MGMVAASRAADGIHEVDAGINLAPFGGFTVLFFESDLTDTRIRRIIVEIPQYNQHTRLVKMVDYLKPSTTAVMEGCNRALLEL